ncbi:hypothetical protein ACOME3_003899 [Neoechinorhynchus agilis]
MSFREKYEEKLKRNSNKLSLKMDEFKRSAKHKLSRRPLHALVTEFPPRPKIWSDEEINELRDVFRLFDLDHDGLIAPDEMLQMFKALSIKATMSDVRNVIASCDRDGDSMINFDEFRDYMGVRYFKENSDSQLRAMFNRFDHNGDGYISPQELDETLSALGLNATSEDFIKCLKSNGGEVKISFEEFKQIMNYKES